ncbi:hypothetical protein ACFLUR_01905 [Chloroflexota bacterium]
MPTNGTDGLSSPYQVTEYAGSTDLNYAVSDTGGALAIQILEITSDEELFKIAENEVISIRITPEHEDLASYLLSKVSQFQSFPNHIFVLPRRDLRFLEEAGISYAEIG